MINLIRMNIFKMFQMKSLYVLLFICIGIGSVLVLESTDTSTDDVEQEISEEQNSDYEVGLTITPSTEKYTLMEYLSEFVSSGCIVIMLGIFMSILSCGERESGFLKNLAACNQHKWQIVVARLVPGVICFLILICGLTASMVITNSLTGLDLSLGNIVGYLPVFGVQLLLHIAFAAAILAVVEITRSQMLTVIFSIFSGFGLIAFLISFISPWIADFMILSRIRATLLPLDTSLLPVTLIVGVVTLIGYSALGGFAFQKRDTY